MNRCMIPAIYLDYLDNVLWSSYSIILAHSMNLNGAVHPIEGSKRYGLETSDANRSAAVGPKRCFTEMFVGGTEFEEQ